MSLGNIVIIRVYVLPANIPIFLADAEPQLCPSAHAIARRQNNVTSQARRHGARPRLLSRPSGR